MKAVLMTAPGGLDVLKLVPVERPARPGPQQLLIRVRAAGVNPLIQKIRKQHFFYPDNLPAILGVRRRLSNRWELQSGDSELATKSIFLAMDWGGSRVRTPNTR